MRKKIKKRDKKSQNSERSSQNIKYFAVLLTSDLCTKVNQQHVNMKKTLFFLVLDIKSDKIQIYKKTLRFLLELLACKPGFPL